MCVRVTGVEWSAVIIIISVHKTNQHRVLSDLDVLQATSTNVTYGLSYYTPSPYTYETHFHNFSTHVCHSQSSAALYLIQRKFKT
jgi:hypothetical protein